MMKTKMSTFLAFATLLALSIHGTYAHALTFQAFGSIQLTGTVDLGGGPVPFSDQSPGSSIAAYNGTIEVLVDDFFNPSTISIQSASLVAQDYPGGPLLPAPGGGPSPGDTGAPAQANYGIELDTGFGFAYAAVRGLVWDLSAPAEPVVGGTFSSLSQTLAATAGTFDVNIGLPPSLGGSASSDPIDTIIVNTAGPSIYTVNGSTAIIVIPFLATAPGSLALEYAGTIVATATIPEPTSCLLLSVGLVGLVGWRQRRRFSTTTIA